MVKRDWANVSEEELIKELERRGVIQHGHYVYTSWRHGNVYVNKDTIYPDTWFVQKLGEGIAQAFVDDEIEIVIAPAIGGVILSQWVAFELTIMSGNGFPTLSVYAEKASDGSFVIKRGYDELVKGKRVLVVEDILTSGGSVAKVVTATRNCGGNVIAVSALWNRNPTEVTAESLAVPKLLSLINKAFPSWPADECDLCADRIPINTDVGHGKQFLEQNPNHSNQ